MDEKTVDLNKIEDLLKEQNRVQTTEIKNQIQEIKNLLENQQKTELASIKSDNIELKHSNDKLETDLKNKSEECNNLKKQIEAQNLNYNFKIQQLEQQKSEKDNEIQQLKQKKSDFLSELNSLNQKNNDQESTIKKLQQQNDDFSRKNESLNHLISEYQGKYDIYEQPYSVYIDLPDNIKQRLINIFGKDNYDFNAALYKWNSIEGLWDYTQRRIIEEDEKQKIINELVELFNLVFDAYRTFDKEKKYEPIKPNIGEKFDSDKHSIKGTKTDGLVDEVLLEGIFDSKLKKVIFKAFVKVK